MVLWWLVKDPNRPNNWKLELGYNSRFILKKGETVKKIPESSKVVKLTLPDSSGGSAVCTGHIFHCEYRGNWHYCFVRQANFPYLTHQDSVKTYSVLPKTLIRPSTALIKDGRRVAKLLEEKYGIFFLTTTLYDQYGRYTSGNALGEFGSWAEFLRRCHISRVASSGEEIFFHNLAKDLRLLFERRKFFTTRDFKIFVDGYNATHKLIVEYDGLAHQSDYLYHEQRIKEVLAKRRALRNLGYKVYIFTEGKQDYKTFINKVVKDIRGSR